MNVNEISKSECCGCSACASVCPRNAIKMCANSKGFNEPVINSEICIDCGLCYSVCRSREKFKKKPKKAYALKHNDINVLKQCTSGGASRALCDVVISEGGIVYGVSYNEKFEVVVSRASTYDECDKFYSSKYVAADVLDTFRSVFDDISRNRTVLYIATSCYISGLLAYLEQRKIDLSKLYTIDLICHGTPSPLIFRDYIKFINDDSDLKNFNFRSKKVDWKYGINGCLIIRKNKEELNTLKSKIFFHLFNSSTILRECCYSCPYVEKQRVADITLSDYWGIEKKHPDFYSPSGVSAVQLNTEKGLVLFNKIKDCTIIETTPDNILEHNLKKATSKSVNTDDFWNMYYKYGFKKIASIYGGYSIKGFLKSLKIYKVWVKIRYGK